MRLLAQLSAMTLLLAQLGCHFCGDAHRSPKIAVFARYVHEISRQRQIPIGQAASHLYDLGVRGFDTSYDDPGLSSLAATVLKPVNLYGRVPFLSQDQGASVVEKFLSVAAKHGVPRVMVIPDGFTKGGDEEREFGRIVEGLQRMVAKAKSRGIEVMVEDVGGDAASPCNRLCYLKRFLAEIPDLRLALDTGNLYYARRGEDILELARHASGRIEHVHIKDQLQDDCRTYSVLGLGGVPNREIVRLIVGEGYDAWYTLENTAKGADVYEETARQIAVLTLWYGDAISWR